ncbi:MAG: EamA family transporter [Deltaproteobacteria bacterium]|nr:EamA family transporter [Deltaproteobacteria bacterium]
MAILIRGTQFPTQTAGWGAIGGGGIVVISTIVAIVAFFEGLKRIGPVHSSMFSNLEPVVTIALACSIFSEEITLVKFIGGLMILAAGIILARKPSKFPPGK